MAKCGKYGDVKVPGIPDDEPIFIVRAQDIFAPVVVRAYALAFEAVTPGMAGRNHAANLREFADRMAAWPKRKLPD
jgi:hypothetical protein